RCARLHMAVADLADDQDAATVWAGLSGLCLVGRLIGGWRRGVEQAVDALEMTLAACAGEEAIVADAVEPARQGVEEEAADELVSRERQDLLPSGTGLAIILVSEGDAGLVEPEEAAVRYGDPVGVAREVSEHGLGPS